ncbi:DUF2946 family protein [Burkholderia alba]|uniref:DUF2946 family protein n=1 Tax=Burkholderia alba TaxID=2683677 RepID=UPI002B0531B5|nr:DUF2946 family protein [Burkholderia alba]
MTTPARRARPTAWLALAAIWIAIVAPVVTQWLPANAQPLPVAALCSARAFAPDGAHPPSSSPAPIPHVKQCGYCDLLAHHPPLPPPFPAYRPGETARTAPHPFPAPTLRAPTRFAFAPSRGPPAQSA